MEFLGVIKTPKTMNNFLWCITEELKKYEFFNVLFK